MVFAVFQYLTSNFISIPLTDIVAWPAEPSTTGPGDGRPQRAGRARRAGADRPGLRPLRVIIVLFGVEQLSGIKDALAKTVSKFSWRGLHVLTSAHKPVASATFVFN